MAYFPMFVDIENKTCLVVGGGKTALRKVRVLLDFGARVHVVSRTFIPELEDLSSSSVILTRRGYAADDLQGKDIVICASDDRALNREIASLCRQRGIAVNVVDCAAESSFIFGSYIKEGDLTGAFSSAGKSPLLTQILRDRAGEYLTPFTGRLNDLLGSLRYEVGKKYDNEEDRKKAYRRIYDYCMEKGSTKDAEEIEKLL